MENTMSKLKKCLSAFAVAAIFLLLLPFAAYAQSAGAGSVVGDAPDGANALEFLARSDQDGTTITHYGYLTHISDLPDESLFSSPVVRTEATARFTFSATTKLTARHLLGNIIATAAVVKM